MKAFNQAAVQEVSDAQLGCFAHCFFLVLFAGSLSLRVEALSTALEASERDRDLAVAAAKRAEEEKGEAAVAAAEARATAAAALREAETVREHFAV